MAIRSKKELIYEPVNGTKAVIALRIDILGNIIGGSLFNWLLLKKPSHFPFGVPGEKISTVIELNYKLDNLSEWGLNLRHDLNVIETDHCKRSLMADLFTARHFLEKYKVIQAKFETIERTKEFIAKY